MQYTSHKFSIFFVSLALFFSFSLVSAEETTTTTEVEKNEVQSLLSQISSLLALVESLQKQISSMDNSGGSVIGEFARNMTLGDRGEDVKALQKLLNSDPRTQITATGPGSKGQETDYFGVLTKNAVTKLQELYKDDILTPVGLSQGNGFVGPSTRNKLNKLTIRTKTVEISDEKEKVENTAENKVYIEISDESKTSTQTESDIYKEPTSNGEYVRKETSFAVGRASSYSASPGEEVTLDGRDLNDDILIHFEDMTSVKGLTNNEGTELAFIVPDIKKGPYELTFTDKNGEKALRIMDFTITVENAVPPEISSIFPVSGPTGTEITVYGINFTKENNQIEFGLKKVSRIPSEDGETLRVVVVSDIDLPKETEVENATWPLWVHLANENGRAPKPAVFVVEIPYKE